MRSRRTAADRRCRAAGTAYRLAEQIFRIHLVKNRAAVDSADTGRQMRVGILV